MVLLCDHHATLDLRWADAKHCVPPEPAKHHTHTTVLSFQPQQTVWARRSQKLLHHLDEGGGRTAPSLHAKGLISKDEPFPTETERWVLQADLLPAPKILGIRVSTIHLVLTTTDPLRADKYF